MTGYGFKAFPRSPDFTRWQYRFDGFKKEKNSSGNGSRALCGVISGVLPIVVDRTIARRFRGEYRNPSGQVTKAILEKIQDEIGAYAGNGPEEAAR